MTVVRFFWLVEFVICSIFGRVSWSAIGFFRGFFDILVPWFLFLIRVTLKNFQSPPSCTRQSSKIHNPFFSTLYYINTIDNRSHKNDPANKHFIFSTTTIISMLASNQQVVHKKILVNRINESRV